MSTITVTRAPGVDQEHRFFVRSAVLMTLVVISGFSVQLAMGRSSFAVPLYLHIHAFFFFGWTALYLVQNLLVGSGLVALHRRLGWLAVIWVPAMVMMGTFVTIQSARGLRVPFFFQPAYFVVLNIVEICTFAGLVTVAMVLRRKTLWHRRLIFCGMSILMGPALGRIIPSPLLIPFTGETLFLLILCFPMAGMIHDLKSSGRIHPAWLWGAGTIMAMQIAVNIITFSPLGPDIYRAVTAGSPGMAAAPLAFPPPP